MNHLGNTVLHVDALQNRGAETHDFSHAFAVASGFQDLGSDYRHRFRIVQSQAACLPFARQFSGHKD
jgi:hypothetical protein